MPKLQAARITQCGLDFAVVLVDPKLFMNPKDVEAFSEEAQKLFPDVPVALLSHDDLKVTRYHGPDDVVAFLQQVRVISLPWVEYTIGEEPCEKRFRKGARPVGRALFVMGRGNAGARTLRRPEWSGSRCRCC